MKKKGFTLIELLAVIVVLAVVMIVAIPIVINLIKSAQKGALKDSVYGIVESADLYYYTNMKDKDEGFRILEFDDNKQIDSYEKLNYKGTIKHGFVGIVEENKVAVCVDDGKYYASKNVDSKDVIVDDGTCTNEFDEDLGVFVSIGSANYIGLRLNVKGYENNSLLPTKASEGTIGVITNKKVAGYYASNEAPNDPVEGTVWVVLNENSSSKIRTKTSSIGVAFVLQYDGGTWVLKESYVYNDKWDQLTNFKNTDYEWNYDYTGHYEEFTAPYSGYYTIELWGAQGASYIGYGAYTKGDIYLDSGETIYIYVGEKGKAGTANVFNGGGKSGNSGGFTGGGATDVRTIPTSSQTVWNEVASLRSRIMVAGAGGGDDDSMSATNDGIGGAGGGLESYTGKGMTAYSTQISGGAFGYGTVGNADGGGGGGGWYGGSGAVNSNAGGAGGSSYISGHTGSNSVDLLGRHTGSSISITGKYFINTKMIDGQGYDWTISKGEKINMPTHDGKDRVTGNEGNGYAKITFKEFDSLNSAQYKKLGAEKQRVWYYPYLGYFYQFKVPKSGVYKIELWGAQGNSYYAYGAYTKGEIRLDINEVLYIYIGEKGKTGTANVFNGGGKAGNGNGNTGGGATDVRTVSTSDQTIWNESASLLSRIMVAGAGGGDDDGLGASNDGIGGYAGGLNSYPGKNNTTYATQISGGAFGYGTNGTQNDAGGGGGGWYGGPGSPNQNGGAAGGSSYISGHNGCIGINENGTPITSSATSINDSYSYTGYKFTNTLMIDGQGYKWTTSKGSLEKMPTHDGTEYMTGNTGNGYAKITYIGE